MIQTGCDISVIICSYAEDRWNDLVAAIESVRQQTLPPQEIIVVIDHNPGLLKRVREYIPDVIVVENTEAQGLSGARNSGIAIAKGQVIAFLDDDAMATHDWLMLFSNGFANPQVLGIGGPITPFWLDKNPAWLPEEFHWVVGCTFRGMPQCVTTVCKLIGANMSFRREIFYCMGGFRSDMGRVGTRPLAGEETELCIRALQRWPQNVFLYLPQAIVFHRVPEQRVQWRYFFLRCYAEGLSKASITSYVGTRDGLASERNYTFRTLPDGVLRGLKDALFDHDLTGLIRAGVIVAGLSVTTFGYLVRVSFLQLTKAMKIVAREKELRRSSELPLLIKVELPIIRELRNDDNISLPNYQATTRDNLYSSERRLSSL
jgi:glucosyl-dolichyl phosphate glucuronosyltransferase